MKEWDTFMFLETDKRTTARRESKEINDKEKLWRDWNIELENNVKWIAY